MEISEKEKYKNIFLKDCKNLIKKYPSKNITGECKNCFLFYIQDIYNFNDFIKRNQNYTDCYRIASFLQDVGLIKIKNGIANSKIDEDRATYYIDCSNLSFLTLPGRNRI